MKAPRMSIKRLDSLQRLGSYAVMSYEHYSLDHIQASIRGFNQRRSKNGNRKFRVMPMADSAAVVLVQNREFKLLDPIFFDGVLYRGRRVNV